MDLSWLQDSRLESLLLNKSMFISPAWPLILRIDYPSVKSHNLIILSLPPETKILLSEEKVRAFILQVWPENLPSS